MKYWEVLLEKQRQRGMSGLTIPFIIGSQKYLSSQNEPQNIEDVIFDIVSGSSFEICVRTCIDINTIVLEKRKENNNCRYPSHNNEQQSYLSIGKSDWQEFGESTESLIAKLKERFDDFIMKGLFTAKPGYREPEWTKFSEDDICFIKDSFKSLTENKG